MKAVDKAIYQPVGGSSISKAAARCCRTAPAGVAPALRVLRAASDALRARARVSAVMSATDHPASRREKLSRASRSALARCSAVTPRPRRKGRAELWRGR